MLYFVTGNQNKFLEGQKIISDMKLTKIDLDEIQAIDPSIIIEHKLKQARLQLPDSQIIVDDSAMEFAALNNFPGPLIKWMLGSLGVDGIWEMISKYDDRVAYTSAWIGHIDETGKINFFQGKVKGEIVEPKGENGFGFDAIFKPNGSDKTFAQMDTDEKNKYSHRAMAFGLLKDYLQGNK